VGNILRRHDIAPAPKRGQTTTWKEFIRRHMDVLAGTDFFTVEVLTWRDLVTYYVLFFQHLETRRVSLAGITQGQFLCGGSHSGAARTTSPTLFSPQRESEVPDVPRTEGTTARPLFI
jgi:hypothetical protein